MAGKCLCCAAASGMVDSTAKRKRRRPGPIVRNQQPLSARALFLLTTSSLLSRRHFRVARGAVVTWSNGPEDTFFCGTSWNEGNCATRQNCRTGRDDECEGHDTHGIQCWANTECDTKKGGAAAWVSGMYLQMTESPAPSASPVEAVDFDTLLEGGLFVPTRSPHTPGDPTAHPTDYPIGPPPPLDYPSLTASDHWFCGVGIDDANHRCEVHCPNSNECPPGQICYFGTSCDSRTHAPTPPPTRGPTGAPTTAEPTVSNPPTVHPTISWPPTHFPTMPLPTASPVQSPTKRPTQPPLTEVQAGMFCGKDWEDVTSACKKRCPGGEDTECPGDESCFAYTGCATENGYGSDPSNWIPGYDEWGNPISEQVAEMTESEAAEFANNVAEAVEEEEPLCKNAEMTITADNWPQEVTWKIVDQDTGNDVVTGNNEELVANEPVSKTICLPSWGCYRFTIYDAGGDGLCCEHGNGMYQVRYDGEVVVNGAAFYDSESAEFGCETDAPTRRPTEQQDLGSGSDTQYRCVADPLVDAGYVVSEGLCDKFVDCYNQYIETGDAFFCGEGESCVLAEACGDTEGAPPPSDAAQEAATEGAEEQESPAKEETAPRPRPAPVAAAPRPTKKPTLPPNNPPSGAPTTMAPSASPTTSDPTGIPTENPTVSPTLGPCGGDPCPHSSFCRSRYGFCGPGDNYCTATAIWTSDCMFQPTQSPIMEPTTPSPSAEPVVWNALDVFPAPSASSIDVPVSDPGTFQKPSGGGKPKPAGGKKPSGAKPSAESQPLVPAFQSPTMEPVTEDPTPEPTPKPFHGTPADELISFQILRTASPSQAQLEEANVEPPDIATRPTPRPTKAADNANGGTSASSDTATDEEDNYSCTGEPCEVETWCRSRYGSCGPGFIYCNNYSIWKKSCPPVPPGTSRRPTPRPTRPPTMGFVASEPGASAGEPTFPPLPGPTLPYISSGGQTFLAHQASRPSAEKTADSSASKDGFDAADSKAEEEDVSDETSDSSQTESEPFYTGMDQWIEFTESRRRNGVAACRPFGGNATIVGTVLAVSFTLTLMFLS